MFFCPLLQLRKYARDNSLTQGILRPARPFGFCRCPRVPAPVSGMYKLNIETKAWSFTLNFGLTNDPQERDLMKKIWMRCYLLKFYLPMKAAIRRALIIVDVSRSPHSRVTIWAPYSVKTPNYKACGTH